MKINTEIAGSFLVMLLLSHHVTSVLAESLENREYNLTVVQYRERYLDEFIEIGDQLPADAVVLAGFDITLGVRFGVPTYRFGPSDDPIHDSIEVVDATHVIIGGVVSRSISNQTSVHLGAPLDPLASSSRGLLFNPWATTVLGAIIIDLHLCLMSTGAVDTKGMSSLLLEGMSRHLMINIIEIIDLRDNSSTGKEAWT